MSRGECHLVIHELREETNVERIMMGVVVVDDIQNRPCVLLKVTNFHFGRSLRMRLGQIDKI